MAVTAMIYLTSFTALREADKWRAHTLIVLRDADRIGELVPALLDGDDRQRSRGEQLIEKLRRETADNLKQQRNIAALAKNFDALTIAVQKRDNANVIRARSDAFHASLGSVTAEEDRLLPIRTFAAAAADRSAATRLWILLATLIVATGGLLLFTFHRLQKQAIAERNRLNEELVNVGALLRGIAEATPGLIYAKDREGRFLLANPPALEFLGGRWSEIKGRTDVDVLKSEREGLTVMANDRRIMASGIAETIEEVASAADGTRRAWLSTKAPLRDSDGEVIGIVGLSVDITDRKDAEARAQELQNEITYLARLGAMGELSLALAHELNQPLATIVNHLSIVEHQLLSAASLDRQELAKRLTVASDQTMRAGDIVKRLRAFAESDNGDRAPELLSALVAEASALISGAAQKRNIEIIPDFERRDIRVLVNRVQVQQVVVSLLQNALEDLSVDGTVSQKIRISLRPAENGLAQVELSYAAAGIHHHQRANINRRFSTTSMSQAGVGVAICQRIVENHGGKLFFSSADSCTRVSLQLPAA